jgi:hypothetical protein
MVEKIKPTDVKRVIDDGHIRSRMVGRTLEHIITDERFLCHDQV